MKRHCLALLILVIALPARASDLQKKVDALVSGYDGHVAVYAKNLTTGETVAIDADRPVQTASVIKLGLMLQTYEQVRAGKLKLSQPVVLTKENQVGGSGILGQLDPGLSLTLKDTITLMITLSDNTATNMLIDTVGLAPTNQMLTQMGLKNTYFYKKVFLAADGPMPADQKQFGLGKTTAAEMAKLMESIYRCDLGGHDLADRNLSDHDLADRNLSDRDLCVQMITIMRNQQYRAMIPRYLVTPDNSETLAPIADKIGMLDAVRNDVAIVYTQRGPVILSIFTYDNADKTWTPENRAEMLVGRLAQAIVNAWSPQGLAAKVTEPLGK
jgi:beta-lactamase class A